MGSNLPSAMASQSLSAIVRVISGFSTPPLISSQVPLATFSAYLPASSPVMFHWSVLFMLPAALGLNSVTIVSKLSATVMYHLLLLVFAGTVPVVDTL